MIQLPSPRFWGQRGTCYHLTGIHRAGNPFAEMKLDAYLTFWIVILILVVAECGQVLLRCLIVVTLQIVSRSIMVYLKMQ